VLNVFYSADTHTFKKMEFQPALYQCFENCGSLKLSVGRHGGDTGCTVKVGAPSGANAVPGSPSR
jgi:hypothetical protein